MAATTSGATQASTVEQTATATVASEAGIKQKRSTGTVAAAIYHNHITAEVGAAATTAAERVTMHTRSVQTVLITPVVDVLPEYLTLTATAQRVGVTETPVAEATNTTTTVNVPVATKGTEALGRIRVREAVAEPVSVVLTAMETAETAEVLQATEKGTEKGIDCTPAVPCDDRWRLIDH